MRHTIVMVTTSYPRFPGDAVGTFLEPIAHAVAARGHDVHVVAPWHPLVRREAREQGVRFHFFRYAPLRRLNVFGYSGALRADTTLRAAAYLSAPLALVAGVLTARAVARRSRATIVHGHWVIPGGFIAARAAGRLPVVVSLHGSDVYVAEHNTAARWAARSAFRRADWVTSCSADLRDRAIALGASAERSEVIPYGVDANRFRPDASWRKARRKALRLGNRALLVFAAGRLVRKKGFEYLIDAFALVADEWPNASLVIAGAGDLEDELRARLIVRQIDDRVRLLGNVAQHDIPQYLAAADVAVVPSVRDAAGNVDGLPNVLMEALASGTAVVTTAAGGIGSIVQAGQTAVVVPERSARDLAGAMAALFADAPARQALGLAARETIVRDHDWAGVAQRFETIYTRVALQRFSTRR